MIHQKITISLFINYVSIFFFTEARTALAAAPMAGFLALASPTHRLKMITINPTIITLRCILTVPFTYSEILYILRRYNPRYVNIIIRQSTNPCVSSKFYKNNGAANVYYNIFTLTQPLAHRGVRFEWNLPLIF